MFRQQALHAPNIAWPGRRMATLRVLLPADSNTGPVRWRHRAGWLRRIRTSSQASM